jgi:hypothetical protein
MAVFAFAALAHAQNPYSTLPRNYKLEFENESVRISRVHYFPGDKLPVHSHPAIPTVYVYVTDGGSIRFKHMSPKFTIDRPAVKAGGVRFNRNVRVETHEVDYLGDAATEYLRLELKTTPGPPRLDMRLRADADFPWEDPQVRISRFHGSPPKLTHPAVLVNVAQRSFAWLDPRRASALPPSGEPDLFVMVELLSGRAGGGAR